MGRNIRITSLWYGLIFNVKKKWKRKICKLGKVGRNPIPQQARSRNKKQKETEI